MYQRALVLEKEKNDIIRVVCPDGACAHCHVSMFCNIKDKSFTVFNKNKVDTSIGDKVEIFMSPKTTVSSTFLVLGFPLLMFPAGYLLAPFANEIAKAGVGLCFSALAFLITYIINKRNKIKLMPVITRVIKLSTERENVCKQNYQE